MGWAPIVRIGVIEVFNTLLLSPVLTLSQTSPDFYVSAVQAL